MNIPQPAHAARLGRPRLLIIGCGDTGMHVLERLAGRKRVFALTSSPRRLPELRAAGAIPLLGNLDCPRQLARLRGLAAHVLMLAPPPGQGEGDPRSRRLAAVLRRPASKARVRPAAMGLGRLRIRQAAIVAKPRLGALARGPGRSRWSTPARPVSMATRAAAGCPRRHPRAPPRPGAGAGSRPKPPGGRRARPAPARRGCACPLARRRAAHPGHLRPRPAAAGTAARRPAAPRPRRGRLHQSHRDRRSRPCPGGRPVPRPAAAHRPCRRRPGPEDGRLLRRRRRRRRPPRPPSLPAAQVRAAVSPAMWSFMQESRRLENRRLAAELRVRLRHPSVRHALGEWYPPES